MAEKDSHQYRSIITGRDRDCLGCRIVSGAGLIGAGYYVHHYAKKNKHNGAFTPMFIISCILGVAGITRLSGAWSSPKSTTNPAILTASNPDKV